MSNKKSSLAPLIRFLEVMPDSRDIELTLLKSHLLIEEALTQIISKQLRKPEHLKRARLGFAQKIELTRAFTDLSNAPWIWKALKLLNQARNELSHNLTKGEVEAKLNKFVEYVKVNSNLFPDTKFDEKFTIFHWAFFITFSVLAVRVESLSHLAIEKIINIKID